jgi:phenylacetate-CoA ligase
MDLELIFCEPLRTANDTLKALKDADQRRLQDYQLERLAATWERAEKSEWYRGRLGLFSPASFRELEVTPREALKQAPKAFDAVTIDEALKYYESSGTSGIATPTIRTRDDIAWNHASVWQQWGEIISVHDRCVILLPSDISPIGDLISGVCAIAGAATLRCFPFAQGIVSWDRIQAIAERYRPTALWSSPGTLIQLGRILRRRGAFAEFAASVNTIMLLGEIVPSSLCAALSRQWNARVYNASYGSTETGTVAATGASDALRLLDYSFLCEIRTPEGIVPAAPGLTGELVVTTLNAFARPLLRFATGDIVRLTQSADARWISLEVLGREHERIRVGQSELFALELEERVYAISGVTGYQLKYRDGELSAISLEHAPEFKGRSSELARSAAASLRQCGVDVPIAVVEELPLTTKSGAGLKNWKRSNVVVA